LLGENAAALRIASADDRPGDREILHNSNGERVSKIAIDLQFVDVPADCDGGRGVGILKLRLRALRPERLHDETVRRQFVVGRRCAQISAAQVTIDQQMIEVKRRFQCADIDVTIAALGAAIRR
jgi:hypothetical protein